MTLADFIKGDLLVFLGDPFAVLATAGKTTAQVLLDEPSQALAGDVVLTTDYQITARAADFGHLLAGDAITVNGTQYTVRDARLIDDGVLCEISLQKV